jgi:hypothetical protein
MRNTTVSMTSGILKIKTKNEGFNILFEMKNNEFNKIQQKADLLVPFRS